jgi:flavin-dependent dehydrogenase
MSDPLTIIGGGLAGLGLANGLAQHDIGARIVESSRYPRHRVCGEFLTGLKPSTLLTLGVDSAFDRAILHKTTAWYSNGQHIRTYALPTPAIGISRFSLDASMAESFRQRGGMILEGQRDNGIPGKNKILAMGRRPTKGGLSGLKGHWTNLPLNADLELHLGQNAYLGLSRVEDGYVNICGLFPEIATGSFSTPLSRFHATLKLIGLGYLCSRLESAELREGSICAVSGLGYSSRTQPGLGDHSRQIPPFTGHGMTMALESAEIALPYVRQYIGNTLSWEQMQDSLHRAISAHGQPQFQAILTTLSRNRILPFAWLYKLTHN